MKTLRSISNLFVSLLDRFIEMNTLYRYLLLLTVDVVIVVVALSAAYPRVFVTPVFHFLVRTLGLIWGAL